MMIVSSVGVDGLRHMDAVPLAEGANAISGSDDHRRAEVGLPPFEFHDKIGTEYPRGGAAPKCQDFRRSVSSEKPGGLPNFAGLVLVQR
jgi:hypothetical protein